MTFTEAIQYLQKKEPLRITIGGDIGSGKSTFAKHLAEILQIPRINIGSLMREEAHQRGITLQELEAWQVTDDTLDKKMDALQREKARILPRAIFEGRASWHFVENTDVNLFLAIRPDIAVERVFSDHSNPLRDRFTTKEELQKADEIRKQSLMKRFQGFYGIDIFDHANFDLIIDTSDMTIDDVFTKTVIKMAEFLAHT